MLNDMPTHHQGTKDEVRALDAFIKLVRCVESVTTRTHLHLDAAGITPRQFGVLEALFHLGPLYQRDIARKLLKSEGNVTLVIDNLEKLGLVERQRSETDRRYFSVCLTEEGRRLMGDVFPRHVEAIVAEMSVLTPAEQEELGRLCRKLGKREA